jgi:type II secretion system protein C
VFDKVNLRDNRYPIGATGLAFCYLLITGISAFKQTDTNTEQKISSNTVSQNQTTQAPQDYSLISEFHLFGQPNIPDSALPDGLPPETELELKLKGVFYFPNQYAHAIIESSDQIQKTYKVNDTLPGGAVLKSIQDDKVILSTNKRDELLILDKIKLEQTDTNGEAQEESVPVEEEQQQEPESTEETETQPLE